MTALIDCSALLSASAADDVGSADAVEALVQDLWDIRAAKMRRSLDQMVRKMATTAQVCRLSTELYVHACMQEKKLVVATKEGPFYLLPTQRQTVGWF